LRFDGDGGLKSGKEKDLEKEKTVRELIFVGGWGGWQARRVMKEKESGKKEERLPTQCAPVVRENRGPGRKDPATGVFPSQK